MQHISQCGGDVYIVDDAYFCVIAILNLSILNQVTALSVIMLS